MLVVWSFFYGDAGSVALGAQAIIACNGPQAFGLKLNCIGESTMNQWFVVLL